MIQITISFEAGWGGVGSRDFDTGSPYNPGWPGTRYIDQAGLLNQRSECLCHLSAGLKVCLPCPAWMCLLLGSIMQSFQFIFQYIHFSVQSREDFISFRPPCEEALVTIHSLGWVILSQCIPVVSISVEAV